MRYGPSRIGNGQSSIAVRSTAASVLDDFLHAIAPERQRPWVQDIDDWLGAGSQHHCIESAFVVAYHLAARDGWLHRAVMRAAAAVDGSEEVEDQGRNDDLFIALRVRAALQYIAFKLSNHELSHALTDVDRTLYDYRHACFLLEVNAYRSALEGVDVDEGTWWGMRIAVERAVPRDHFESALRDGADPMVEPRVWVAMIAQNIRKMCAAAPEHHVKLKGYVDHADGPVDAVHQIWQWLQSKDGPSIVILGPEGSGRTSLMDKVLLDWADKPRYGMVLVPVLDVMKQFSVGCTAKDRATARLKALIAGAPDDVLERLKRRFRVVFVVDGFPSDMQPGIMEIVQALVMLALGGASVVASSSDAMHSAASAIGRLLIKNVPGVREQDRLKRLRLLGMSDGDRRELVRMFRKTHPDIHDSDMSTFDQWLRLIPEQESIGGSMYHFNLALTALRAGAFTGADAQGLAEKEPYLFLIEHLLGVWAAEEGVDADRVRAAFEAYAWDELRTEQPLPPVDKPLLGEGEPSDRVQMLCGSAGAFELPPKLRRRAELFIQWNDGSAIGSPRFRHREIRDTLVLKFLIQRIEERSYDLIFEQRQLWKAIRLLARYAATSRADKLVAHVEQDLCKRESGRLEVSEAIFWHLVASHHRCRRTAVPSCVRRRALERFCMSTRELMKPELTWEAAIVNAAAARETAMLLDFEKRDSPGAHIQALVGLARRIEPVEAALADIVTAYYAGRTGAVVRIVERLKDPDNYAPMQFFDLLDLGAIVRRAPPSAEAELMWAWNELAKVFKREHDDPAISRMRAEALCKIADRLRSFTVTDAAG